MKNLARIVTLFLALGAVACADDTLREVQTQLKTLGFYYGEANGQTSAETTAAIRRYQIRSGLEVTGSLSKETLDALGMGADAGTRVEEAASPAAAPPQPKPPVKPPRNRSVEESDKNFLRREEARRAPAPLPPDNAPSVVPPQPRNEPSSDLPALFAETPFATAPREVQESTLRRAQTTLAGRRFYRGPIDGTPGPTTEEALLSFQHSTRLTLTGRLDLDTLNALRLLPGHGPVPLQGFYPEPRPSANPRVYRGIWIH